MWEVQSLQREDRQQRQGSKHISRLGHMGRARYWQRRQLGWQQLLWRLRVVAVLRMQVVLQQRQLGVQVRRWMRWERSQERRLARQCWGRVAVPRMVLGLQLRVREQLVGQQWRRAWLQER